MDDSKLSVEQLTALSRAVPEEQERRDLGLFLRVGCVPLQEHILDMSGKNVLGLLTSFLIPEDPFFEIRQIGMR